MGLNWEMHKVQLQPCLVIIWELFPFPNQGDQFGNWLVPKVISMLDPSLTQFSTRIAPVSLGWEFTNISCGSMLLFAASCCETGVECWMCGLSVTFVSSVNFVLFAETSVSEIEEAFLQFTNRSDIAILLINQNVSS